MKQVSRTILTHSIKKKLTTFNNIPIRLLVENNDIISPFITDICNESISNVVFPDSLKLADITPAHKKEERTKMDNYRPVSILPSISKIFERNMYDLIIHKQIFITLLVWFSQRL